MRTYLKRRLFDPTASRQFSGRRLPQPYLSVSRSGDIRRFSLQSGGGRHGSFAIGVAVAILLVCFSAASASALPPLPLFPHHNPLHKKIADLEMKWRDALLTNNIAEISNLLADDYLGISANGTLQTKADVLANRRTGRVKFTRLDLSDIKIRIYGTTAVVTSKADVEGTSESGPIGGHFRYTRVYTERGKQWKIVSFEASRVHPHHHD